MVSSDSLRSISIWHVRNGDDDNDNREKYVIIIPDFDKYLTSDISIMSSFVSHVNTYTPPTADPVVSVMLNHNIVLLPQNFQPQISTHITPLRQVTHCKFIATATHVPWDPTITYYSISVEVKKQCI